MRCVLIGLIFLSVLSKSPAQIWRSGGFDDTSSNCRGLTCTWASADPVHQRIAGYEFYLDPVPDDSPGSLVVQHAGKELLRTDLKDILASVTITCAAGCTTFAVTWSDGGVIGNFHTRVFHSSGSRFVETNAVSKAFHQFKSKHDCPTRGDNIQAYRFEGSQSLMLILSVYPTGDCEQLGFTQGYLVSVSDGTVLRVLSQPLLTRYIKTHPEGE